MALRILIPTFLIAMGAARAQPLPELRIEPVTGGSIFYIKNTASQPVSAFLIELVNYPGSYYSLWQDESGKRTDRLRSREAHPGDEYDGGSGSRLCEAAGRSF